jgi:hypothetical protein
MTHVLPLPIMLESLQTGWYARGDVEVKGTAQLCINAGELVVLMSCLSALAAVLHE